jgi:hypothetical protein
VVVYDLDVVCIPFTPSEANPPLIVDADAVLPTPITRQLLESVSRWASQVIQNLRRIQDQQLAKRHALQLQGPPPHTLTFEDLLGIAVPEALDHLT